MLPESKTRIRRMGVTSDDMIWYGDWSNGKLAASILRPASSSRGRGRADSSRSPTG